jgi:hypothetical protein
MKIEDFYWQSEVGDHWAQLVEAAGCGEPNHGIADIFLLGGLIQHDSVVAARFAERMRGWRPSEAEKWPPSHNFYIDVLLMLSVEEKRALKQRLVTALAHSRQVMKP